MFCLFVLASSHQCRLAGRSCLISAYRSQTIITKDRKALPINFQQKDHSCSLDLLYTSRNFNVESCGRLSGCCPLFNTSPGNVASVSRWNSNGKWIYLVFVARIPALDYVSIFIIIVSYAELRCHKTMRFSPHVWVCAWGNLCRLLLLLLRC